MPAWMSFTEFTNTGWSELPLDDLEHFRYLIAESHGIATS